MDKEAVGGETWLYSNDKEFGNHRCLERGALSLTICVLEEGCITLSEGGSPTGAPCFHSIRVYNFSPELLDHYENSGLRDGYYPTTLVLQGAEFK